MGVGVVILAPHLEQKAAAAGRSAPQCEQNLIMLSVAIPLSCCFVKLLSLLTVLMLSGASELDLCPTLSCKPSLPEINDGLYSACRSRRAANTANGQRPWRDSSAGLGYRPLLNTSLVEVYRRSPHT